MNIKRRLIDIAMIVLLPVLMAYSLVGETLHEAAGILMFALFIAHHVINRAWFRGLFKGKYNRRRVVQTTVNLLLLIVMVVQPVSGVLMSKHLLISISISGTAATMREVHLCLAYWGFVLMSMHTGMHMGPLMNKLIQGRSKSGVDETINVMGGEKSIDKIDDEVSSRRKRQIVVNAAVALISAYGMYAFIKRGLPSYMFLTTAFAFFDFGEPRIYFFADYTAIMMLFAFAGYIISVKKRE